MHPVSLARVSTTLSNCAFRSNSGNPVKQTETEFEPNQRKNYLFVSLSGLAMLAAAGVMIRKNSGKLSAKSNEICQKIEETTHLARPQIILTFNDLVSNVKQAKLKKVSDYLSNCVAENCLGRGRNSSVFKFSNPVMKDWCIKVDKGGFVESGTAPIELEKVEDEFGGINMGQKIAGVSKNVSILRLIQGEPHSVADWAARRTANAPILPNEALTFMSKVKKISKMPQRSFDEYAGKLKLLDDKGYKVDSFNPNNFLIDYQNEQIHIIDAYKYKPDEHRNSGYDLFCPLVDYANYEKYFNVMSNSQRKVFQQSTRKIEEKCTKAAEKHGIPVDESIFTQFIADVDSREKNGKMYTQCYKAMRQCMRAA